MKTEKWGEYAALLGVIVAVLVGLAAASDGLVAGATSAWIAVLLVVLGIIVGLTTIAEKEVTSFLIAAIALVVSSVSVPAFGAFSGVPELAVLGSILTAIFQNIATLIAPAAVIVAFKAVWSLASRR
ncbi:MAG: hypothetical protein HYW25_05880 [Candidatus Aenigmarchaeota archaeon]|nr:hypothetical protein [Candidatus Aenigmarchaeota archaeon]